MTRDETVVRDRPVSARTSAEIEEEIGRMRARMDRTLDEIEYRLSPGQLTGGVLDVARDLLSENPGRIGRAIRDNPVPVALIGIGVTWLALAALRTPRVETGLGYPAASGAVMSDQRIIITLRGLVTVARQAEAGFAEAERVVTTPGVRGRLRPMAEQYGRTAAALEEVLRRYGGEPEPGAPIHPAWNDLRGALEEGHNQNVLTALERGADGTLRLFRDALHEGLPADLRVLIGSHFHEVEGLRNRVGAVKEAVA